MLLYTLNGDKVKQGSPEDKATWWTCSYCNFTGPHVGSIEPSGRTKRCMASCGGKHLNPNAPRSEHPLVSR